MDDPAATTAPPVLRLEQVGKVYPGGIAALEDLSFAVGRGEIVTLLGPSGCGKSTALRLIAGLVPPSSGRIVRGGGEWGRGDLGMVFQEPTLMPWASVERNVGLPLRLAGASVRSVRNRIREALALVGLEAFAARYPRELSGGMRMRVAIARALVTDPRLILMDEPFGALDEITRHRLNADLLALAARTGATIVFVTHSVPESVFLSDRILVMAARPGRIVTEIAGTADRPRASDWRGSADFSRLARSTSEALARAMAGIPATAC